VRLSSCWRKDSIIDAEKALSKECELIYKPIKENVETYNKLYVNIRKYMIVLAVAATM